MLTLLLRIFTQNAVVNVAMSVHAAPHPRYRQMNANSRIVRSPDELVTPQDRILQSGALPYRIRPDGLAEVLLVTTTFSESWAIPKGRVAEGHTFASSAAKEAEEEAGVVGNVGGGSVGMYRALQRAFRGQPRLIEVWVYLLEVTGILDAWDEQGCRSIKWFPAARAASLVDEPLLADLCRRLAAGDLRV